MNVREVLIILLTMCYVYIVFSYNKSKSKTTLLWFLVLIPLITITRIYLLLPLFGASFISSIVSQKEGVELKKVFKQLLSLSVLTLLFCLFLLIYYKNISSVLGWMTYLIELISLNINGVVNFIKFWLTPLPWRIDVRYATISSIAHWLCFIFFYYWI